MGLFTFISELFENGNVVLETSDEPGQDEFDKCFEHIVEVERLDRMNLPCTPPSLDKTALLWAAVRLYRSCQFLAYRDLPAEQVCAEINQPCPYEKTPSVVYSVDFFFRYLPDCLKLSSGLSPGDPLVDGIIQLGKDWPLSSVGMDGVEEVEVDDFIQHPCLGQLYVDRIIDKHDTERVKHELVRDLIRRSIGIHKKLSPSMFDFLRKEDEQ